MVPGRMTRRSFFSRASAAVAAIAVGLGFKRALKAVPPAYYAGVDLADYQGDMIIITYRRWWPGHLPERPTCQELDEAYANPYKHLRKSKTT